MKTSWNINDYKKKLAYLEAQALNVYPPAVLFSKKKKQKGDAKSEAEPQDQFKKIPVPLDKTKPKEGSAEWKLAIFEDGDAEDWIKWRMAFDDLAKAIR